MNTAVEAYRRVTRLYQEEVFGLISEPVLSRFTKALQAHITPPAAKKLYQTQKEALEEYEVILLGLFDDFALDVEAATQGDIAVQEKKRRARDYVATFRYLFERASWEWLAYAWLLGKLSVWWGDGDYAGHRWRWEESAYYLNREGGLIDAILIVLDDALEKERSPKEALDQKVRWRVKMFGGELIEATNQATLYRPPVEDRVKLARPWKPEKVQSWTFPILVTTAIPPRWVPPTEWGVPEEVAIEVEVDRKRFLWVGYADEKTCRGPEGCMPQIGKIHTGLDLLAVHPGNRLCLSNCRCFVLPIGGDNEIVVADEEYALPFP